MGIFTHAQACVGAATSAVSDSETVWTVVRQSPLSIEFSRQEYGSGLPGHLPKPGIETTAAASPALQVDSLPVEPPGKSIETS